jgi:nicotinamide-nucleotide amidase
MRVEAEIVATGDELMSGAVVDSNSATISRRLRDHGVLVRRKTMVGDGEQDIETALREASARVPIVIVTGGLGPTEDDRTAACAARLAGVTVERNAEALAHVKEMFRRFGREMPPNNEKQADLPKGSEILANPVGTAVGFAMNLPGGARAFFTPGVPREMEKMLEEQILPRVDAIRTAKGATTALATRVVKSYGLGESKVEMELSGVKWAEEITVGYRAKFPEIHLRLYAEGAADRLAPALQRAEASIRERLGVRVFGVDDDTMASVVGALLKKKGWTISVAESCTGGLLGSLITEIAGSSEWFDRGFVTYSNAAKTALLGVKAATIAEHGAVSEPVVREMAAGAREKSGSPIALAITGVAGPGGGTPEKPVGTVWIACATPDTVDARKLQFPGDRERVRLAAAYAAMDLARRHLVGAA